MVGKAQAADGRLAEARAALEGALQLESNYADAHAQLGAVLWQQ
jgi:Flp pilus assembly protein TadD